MAASISDIRALLKVKVLPKSADSRRVFLTGGTGQIGAALIPILLERGHRVRALIRAASKAKLPAGCEVVSGNALDSNTYIRLIRPADTFIHLVGAPHTSTAKAADFRAIDLVSAQQAVNAGAELGVHHFIYLSIAHPAPLGIKKDYIAVRVECERLIQQRQLNATIVRPWSVIVPGQRRFYGMRPFYKMWEWLPLTRDTALRLGMVSLDQLILALVEAVETPVQGTRIVGVPEIRSARLDLSRAMAGKTA